MHKQILNSTAEQFHVTLMAWDHARLTHEGFLLFQRTNIGDLYLFPAEWAQHLPDGLQVTDVFFKTYTYHRGLSPVHVYGHHINYGILFNSKAPTHDIPN